MKNMVDERFEFISVIFRLAGNWEYSFTENDYQKEVAEKFAKYERHEVVEYAKNLGVGYNKVFRFSVHIEKKNDKFLFIENLGSLYDGTWNEENTKKFLKLFNKFYVDTNYAEFFNSKIAYFEEITQNFIDETYSKIDLEWFRKYLDPSNLRCIYSPSSGNYGQTVNDKIVYCLVYGHGGAVGHEYRHSFTNPIADKWYKKNPKFKKWCDDSVNTEKMPYYNNGWIMALECVVRSYDILYAVQHGKNFEECLSWIRDDEREPFPYIEEVYKMVLELENENFAV